MKNLVNYIQKTSDTKRRSIAFTISTLFTVMLALGWLTTLPEKFNDTPTASVGAAAVKESSPSSIVVANIKTGSEKVRVRLGAVIDSLLD